MVEEVLKDADDEMGDSSQPTQQATQPYEDPRRLGKNISDVSEDDTTDVICLLHPTSPAAINAVAANMLIGPQHILQNTDLEGITEDDVLLDQDLRSASREFALRMSSNVKFPKDGFRFGRNPASCDVVLTGNVHDKLISNTHFKIFVNSQGSLMLQDLSTNGTIVDDDHLRTRDRQGNTMLKPPTRALKNGAIICVLSEPARTEIKLMVRIPNRGDNEDLYEAKLKKYLAARGKVAQFASMRESSYGNHWNGGSRYNFTGLLGKGAFATVYRVQTKMEGEVFAAKELDKRRFIKNGILDIKFDSELKIMKNLKHPNIVDYIDCVTHENWIYIIMEHIPYGELAHELRSREFLPEPEVQEITRQILHALDYLHRQKITHRDIKPDNILIASRSPLVVKLSDFGLSKSVSDQETFLKTFCGTLLYCAPEVYPDYANYMQSPTTKRRRLGEPTRHISPYDQSVDMWSFGAVIFHLLCGKAPITGRGDDRGAQMLSNIMTKDVDFDPLRARQVSEEAIDFVSQLLNRNPSLRPKEAACLQHHWLRNVRDRFGYEDVNEEAGMLDRDLGVLDEVDEDLLDDELIRDLDQLTQPPTGAIGSSSTTSPARPSKRAKLTANSEPVSEVTYPALPPYNPTFPPIAMPQAEARLFGEISGSVLRSSGVFGAHIPATANADVPEILHRVEQISVNDFGTFGTASSRVSADISGQQLQHPQTLALPAGPSSSAPSLMGAEVQIGQLNMASPDAEASDAPTPDTAIPVTPRTRELSPSSSVSNSAEKSNADSHRSEAPRFTRQIDVDLIADDTVYAAEVEARNASRAEKLRAKAETFQVPTRSITRAPSVELARTIDAKTGLEVRYSQNFDRTIAIDQNQAGTKTDVALSRSAGHPRRYGKLTTISGSFADLTVNLEDWFTMWGRGLDCTVQYPDRKDVRVPKYGIKMRFWAPGIEEHISKGGDWTKLAGIRTIVSTSASGAIYVNEVELRKETAKGDASLYGKVYTGDIIAVYDSLKDGFLKFRVEIMYGDSARPRPADQAGFKVQKEVKYHQQMKEKSMRASQDGNEASALPTTRAASAS